MNPFKIRNFNVVLKKNYENKPVDNLVGLKLIFDHKQDLPIVRYRNMVGDDKEGTLVDIKIQDNMYIFEIVD